MKHDYIQILNVATEAAKLAGEAIVRARSQNTVEVDFKGKRDLVTSADLEAEKIIIERIEHSYPTHVFLSEENHPNGSSNRLFNKALWIIDPIDGTINYAHGHHHVGISIAFANKGTVVVGVVYAPFYGEMFTAVKGRGASVNGQSISVRQTSEPIDALIATGSPVDQSKTEALFKRDQTLLTNCRSVRRLGSAAVDMCWVASGKVDMFCEDVYPWDMAAGALIAREAGAKTGQINSLNGQPHLPEDLRSEGLLVANPTLFDKFKGLLQEKD